MRLLDYNSENQKKRKGLLTDPESQRYIDEGRLEVSERLSRSALLNPESYAENLTDEDYTRFGKERIKEREHGVLGEFAAGLGRGALRVAATPAYLADIAGEAVGWKGLERAGEIGAEKVEKFIAESPRLKKSESISKDILKSPELWTDPRWYSSLVGEGLPTILSMLVPGMAAAKVARLAGYGIKGVQAARIAGGMGAAMGLEAGGAAEDIRQYEKTGEKIPISTKLQSVLGTGVVAGSLEYVPIFTIFGRTGAQKLVKRIITGMVTEGSTEGAQELVANAFAKVGYDADRNMVGGVVESVVGGVLLGGGMGAISRATNFQERVKEADSNEVANILEQAEKETTENRNIINMIDEGMITGEIRGESFTPEVAMAVIGEAYADKTLTDSDINSFKEKYPELQSGLNNLMGIRAVPRKKLTARDILLDEDEKGATAKDILTKEKPFPVPPVEDLIGAESLEAEEAVAAVGEEALEEAAEVIPEKLIKREEITKKPAITDKQIDEGAQEAATSPENKLPEPTEAQIEAGNYKKGHIKVQGFDISVENPEGSQRTGTSPDGKKWSITMAGHYGYFKRSEGKDGEQIDVFVNAGDRKESDKAYIVDQVDPKTGRFDEHKVMLGYSSLEAAEKGYLANYEKGWKGLGNITEISIDDLKEFIGKRQAKPYAGKEVPKSELKELAKAKEIEIPTFTSPAQAISFGEKATPEQIAELKRLRKESAPSN